MKTDDEHIRSTDKSDYKIIVKNTVNKRAFSEYLAQQKFSNKLKNIKYGKFKAQEYIN